jgi:glutamate mutase epsilon subunit
MAQYRQTRNIEASVIDFLRDELELAWENVNIEKSFSKIYTLTLPSVCVRVGITSYDPAEIGNNKTIRTAQVLIDIFATDDGMRLDLKDFIIDTIKDGCVYYEFKTAKSGRTSIVEEKEANGRIRVLSIADTPIDFDIDKDKLDPHDRFRHLLTLNISLGRIE